MTVADIRRRTAEAMGEEPAEDCMPCGWCNEPTPRAALSAYGARCYRCYEAYKREPQPARRHAQAGPQPTPREVVQRLLDRKAAGEEMSAAQLRFIATASRRTHPELHHGDQP